MRGISRCVLWSVPAHYRAGCESRSLRERQWGEGYVYAVAPHYRAGLLRVAHSVSLAVDRSLLIGGGSLRTVVLGVRVALPESGSGEKGMCMR